MSTSVGVAGFSSINHCSERTLSNRQSYDVPPLQLLEAERSLAGERIFECPFLVGDDDAMHRVFDFKLVRV